MAEVELMGELEDTVQCFVVGVRILVLHPQFFLIHTFDSIDYYTCQLCGSIKGFFVVLKRRILSRSLQQVARGRHLFVCLRSQPTLAAVCKLYATICISLSLLSFSLFEIARH